MEKNQQQIEHADRQPGIPLLPFWPTSVPGPQITEPPSGTKRLRIRTEQVIAVNYDAEQGKPGRREA